MDTLPKRRFAVQAKAEGELESTSSNRFSSSIFLARKYFPLAKALLTVAQALTLRRQYTRKCRNQPSSFLSVATLGFRRISK